MSLRCSRYLLALFVLNACTSATRDEIEPEPELGTDGAGTDDGADDDALGQGPTDKLDLGGGGDTIGFGEPEQCASFTETAAIGKQPADIIFVVDNSPSMGEEADAVQFRLNDFSEQIVDAGIDIRVLLLTAYPNPEVAPIIDTGICIDPPLGGGGCPATDDNQPLFAHLHENIGSSHSLQKILDTQPTWAPMMRPDSSKHIIVVSDDDSYLQAEDFDAQFKAFDESYANYKLHGIVSTSPCVFADTLGEEYIKLADMTGGVLGDLCQQEFQPLFDLLSTAVQEGSSLACEWDLPEPPAGSSIDLQSVEVQLSLDGMEVDAPHVETVDDCYWVAHGWYYDTSGDAPQLVACPQTCNALQYVTEAELEIDVGCATPPQG